MRWYIYDENEHNTTVFGLRVLNAICSSSGESDAGER